MINSRITQPQRPKTALKTKDIKVGDKIVCYKPSEQSFRMEVVIVDIEDVVDKGEVSIQIRYSLLNDPQAEIYCANPSDLGLSPDFSGNWEIYAIPFDEN